MINTESFRIRAICAGNNATMSFPHIIHQRFSGTDVECFKTGSVIIICLCSYYNKINKISTYRILRVMDPEWCTRMNSLLVVAIWKYDCFSFTKNVSGTQIFFINSEPTDNVSTPGLFLYASRGSVQNWRK